MPTEVTTNRVATEAIQASRRPGQASKAAGGPSGAEAPRQALPGEQSATGNVPPSKQAETTEPNSQQIDRAVSQLNDYIQSVRRDLHFKVDEDAGRTIIEVVDSETKEVIRTIPPTEVLNLAAKLQSDLEKAEGLIIQARA